jgi:ribosomal protein S18 acetylase RimI-like enzyme
MGEHKRQIRISKRAWFIIFFLGFAGIYQLAGIQFFVATPSNHSLEFSYIYTYQLTGTGGTYSGYYEDFTANGHYTIDDTRNVGHVDGTVNWQLVNNTGTTTQTSTYVFSYGLTNGSYIGTNDQDPPYNNEPGWNVWFQVPGGFVQGANGGYVTALGGNDTWQLIGTTFSIGGLAPCFMRYTLPASAVELIATGSYLRAWNDPYGSMIATYHATDYFTKQGYFLGEIWSEDDNQRFNSQAFHLESQTFVTSASFSRELDWITWLLVYVIPIMIMVALAFPIYNAVRWHPRRVVRGADEIVFQRGIPANTPVGINSPYKDCIPAYITRVLSADGIVVSAVENGVVKGIGLVEPGEPFGSFYIDGTIDHAARDLVKFAGVGYGFAEVQIPATSVIETYTTLEIGNLQGRTFSFDVEIIKPLTSGKYLQPVMKMVANEDNGARWSWLANWVKTAATKDIAVVAAAPLKTPWVQQILAGIHNKKMRPEIAGEEVIMGVGFATPAGSTGWLYGLYVHPAFRNRGIGRSLALARLTALRNLGATTAITEIAEWNSPSLSIYDRLGATGIGKIYMFGKKAPRVKARRH